MDKAGSLNRRTERDNTSSSVGIATQLWFGSPRNNYSIAGRCKMFSFSKLTVTGPGAHSVSYSMDTRTIFFAGNGPEHKSAQSFPGSADTMNKWSYTYSMSYAFKTRTGTNLPSSWRQKMKRRKNFPLGTQFQSKLNCWLVTKLPDCWMGAHTGRTTGSVVSFLLTLYKSLVTSHPLTHRMFQGVYLMADHLSPLLSCP